MRPAMEFPTQSHCKILRYPVAWGIQSYGDVAYGLPGTPDILYASVSVLPVEYDVNASYIE